MEHVPSLCVLCSPCYSRWCYGKILAIAPLLTINVWERIGEKHLAQLMGEGACQPDIFTKYRLGCELTYVSCHISLCALNNKGYKAYKEMGHVPSLCVLCNPCYLRWCYGQILAIAPLQSMYGREWEKNT